MERPIIMTGESVRAILDDRKTQTRRVITHCHGIHFLGGADEESDPSCWGWSFDGPDHSGYMVLARGLNQRYDHGLISLPCPHGAVGDRLWVKETWCLAHPDYHTEEDGRNLKRPLQDGRWCHYAATDDVEDNDGKSPWRSPLFMPRWVSRITLEITNVRVQRVQDISEEDARAEGAPLRMSRAARGAFAAAWDSINAKRAPWVANPWVWAITFKRVS